MLIYCEQGTEHNILYRNMGCLDSLSHYWLLKKTAACVVSVAFIMKLDGFYSRQRTEDNMGHRLTHISSYSSKSYVTCVGCTLVPVYIADRLTCSIVCFGHLADDLVVRTKLITYLGSSRYLLLIPLSNPSKSSKSFIYQLMHNRVALKEY